MTLDTTINLPTLLSFGVVVIGFIIWLVRLEGKVGTTVTDVTDLKKTVDVLHSLVTLHKEQFHEYQLQVAKDYTTHAGIAEMKRDIITELGRVEARVETQIDRLIEARMSK